MNYIKQIQAFHDRMLTKPLSSGQIALWYALMYINNKAAWIGWFTVANQTLESQSGLSRSGIQKARNQLRQLGYIQFKPNGTKATSYNIIDLSMLKSVQDSNQVEATMLNSNQVSVQVGTQDSNQVGTQDSNQARSTLNKQNETKQNKTKYAASSSTDHISDNTAVSYWLNQVNPTEAPMILESIGFWVKDFNGQDEIVIAAIDEMLKNDARSFKYLERVLKSWESKGLNTVEKVQKYLDGHYSNKNSNRRQGGKWTDKSLWDYWWAERMSGNPSIHDFCLKKNLSDSEIQRLKQIICEKGYECEIS